MLSAVAAPSALLRPGLLIFFPSTEFEFEEVFCEVRDPRVTRVLRSSVVMIAIFLTYNFHYFSAKILRERTRESAKKTTTPKNRDGSFLKLQATLSFTVVSQFIQLDSYWYYKVLQCSSILKRLHIKKVESHLYFENVCAIRSRILSPPSYASSTVAFRSVPISYLH